MGILLLDGTDDAQVYMQVLTGAGYSVDHAQRYIDAMRLLKDKTFDIAIIDPIDSIECSFLPKNPRIGLSEFLQKDIPVILYSVLPQENLESGFGFKQDVNFQLCLNKFDVDARKLVDIIRSL